MSPGYIPFHPNPSKPTYKPPIGAVDAHNHVFGPEARFPFAPKRKYTPCDAPKEKLFALHDFLGFDKAVIVQATCHDTDNRALVDALVTSSGRARGVAFVGDEITDAELQELDRAGIRGVRFNFIKRLVDSTPRDVMQRIATRIAPLGWHIVIYFEHADLEEMEPFLKSLPTTLVFDHMACPDVKAGVNARPFQNWLKALDANATWITKVTCPERFTVTGPPYDDVVPFAKAIVDRFPERVIWGTDWPHPNMPKEAPDDGVIVDMIPRIAVTADLQRKLLVDNPMRLYWS
jgi:2-pyrone-4,6-dicarboxylate lactonase